MNNFLKTSCLITLFSLPYMVLGQGLVPCEGVNCGFNDLVQLAKNILDFIVMASIPAAVLGIVYAGYLYLTAGVEGTGNIAKAKDIFVKIVIGLVLILGAWLIVYTITSTLFQKGTYENFLS
tara:strand:- start:30 stop:395 length:366 start_codon:yes stop_codon:yes gene_type:complete